MDERRTTTNDDGGRRPSHKAERRSPYNRQNKLEVLGGAIVYGVVPNCLSNAPAKGCVITRENVNKAPFSRTDLQNVFVLNLALQHNAACDFLCETLKTYKRPQVTRVHCGKTTEQ